MYTSDATYIKIKIFDPVASPFFETIMYVTDVRFQERNREDPATALGEDWGSSAIASC